MQRKSFINWYNFSDSDKDQYKQHFLTHPVEVFLTEEMLEWMLMQVGPTLADKMYNTIREKYEQDKWITARTAASIGNDESISIEESLRYYKYALACYKEVLAARDEMKIIEHRVRSIESKLKRDSAGCKLDVDVQEKRF